MGGSAMDVAEASLQGAGIENGAAAARRHQPIHGAHAKLGGIGQYRPPPNGDIHVYLRASLGLLLKRAPFSFQDRTGPFHFIIGSGQMHEGRRRRGDLRSSIGPYATLEACLVVAQRCAGDRSEEHTSELQSLMRISYAVFCLKKKKNRQKENKQSNR